MYSRCESGFLKPYGHPSRFVVSLRQFPTNIEHLRRGRHASVAVYASISYMFFKFLWVVTQMPINETSNGTKHTSVLSSTNDKDILADVIPSAVCGGSQAVNGGGLKIHSHRSSRVRIPPSASKQDDKNYSRGTFQIKLHVTYYFRMKDGGLVLLYSSCKRKHIGNVRWHTAHIANIPPNSKPI